MDGCPERALDTHIYQAWRNPDSRIGFFVDACRQKSIIATMEREFGPVVVGEWSLATDNCAMWLNGKFVCYVLSPLSVEWAHIYLFPYAKSC